MSARLRTTRTVPPDDRAAPLTGLDRIALHRAAALRVPAPATN